MNRSIFCGWLLPALTCLCSADLSAQQPEKPTPEVQRPAPEVEKPEERRRIEREVAERLREMREGRVVRSHVRVTVWLTNGNRLLGVVKNGRFVEKHNGSTFVEANPNDRAVGIRLWYSDNTNSYIFLPFHSIARYRIGERLSEEQVRDLGAALQRAADERAEKAREQADARRRQREGQNNEGQGPTPTPGGPAPAPAGESRAPQLSAEEAALLSEFPPSAGWGPEKVAELQRRQVVLGVFPNAIERKFLDNFDAWTAAVKKQEAIDKAKAGSVPSPAGGPGQTPVPGQTPTPGTTGEAEQAESGSSRRRRARTRRGGRVRRYRGETENEPSGTEPSSGGSQSPAPAPGGGSL
ncbi:MAG: hypothetical protein AAF196_02100 [Planctomycetota bacterium]